MAIKHYEITLTTLGPVHIGSGKNLGKKDYFIVHNNTNILDSIKFYKKLTSNQKMQYESFLEDEFSNLTDFITKQNLVSLANECTSYKITGFKPEQRRNRNIYHDVNQFIRDGQGDPYVPGSSLKGIIRTIILGYLVSENSLAFTDLVDPSRKDYGSRKLEDKVFVKRKLVKSTEVDYNLMQYISVSDSKVLRNDDLMFAKKFDMFSFNDPNRTTKEGNELNIYKESIKPGIDITFKIEIDEDNLTFKSKNGYFAINANNLVLLIRNYYWYYKNYIMESFTESDDHEDEIVYLGGGSGFGTKTINVQLYKDKTIHKNAQILYKNFPTRISDTYKYANVLRREIKNAGFDPKTMNPRGKMKKNDHRHWQYESFGVSPHTLKCTKIDGNIYEFGKCKISIKELK